MYISQLSIRNYRNFKSSLFEFKKGVNTLIGENGSGKSNALTAMRLLIDDSLPRNLRFYETDFNRGLDNWRGHWIIVSIQISDLDVSEAIQALVIHGTGDADNPELGSYNLYFRPKYSIRKSLFDLSRDPEKNLEALRVILDAITIDDYELLYTGKGTINITDDVQYSAVVGDFTSINFPNPDELLADILGVPVLNQISIPKEVSCTFVPALRNVERELRSSPNSPLINLLRGKDKAIPIDKRDDIEGFVRSLNTEIAELEEIKEVSLGISSSIRNAVGETYAPNISIKSELPTELERLFQSLTLWVGDPDEDGYQGRLWELSLGGANLVYLSLKLLEYNKVLAQNRVANFLLIEEPEAHIHTHIQKTLFDKVNEEKTQVIISTHSTHISSVSKISSVNIMRRANSHAKVFQPSNGLTTEEIKRLERYLDAVRSNLLFAKGIVLIEGDAEQILIPAMFEKALGVNLDEIGVSLVNIGSTGFKNVARIFHTDRIQTNCAILTDADTAFIPLPDDANDDDPSQRKARNSQKIGASRQIDLNEFAKGNPYVQVFLSEHTFEVDFVQANNAPAIVKILETIYTDPATISKSKENIMSADISIFGSEVLKLANYVGKGWFATLIGDNLDLECKIPDYILNAVAFASPAISDDTLVRLSKKKVRMLIDSGILESDDFFAELSNDEISTADKISLYQSEFPDCSLTRFMQLILHARVDA